MTKPCRICKVVKELSEFHAHKTAADKHRGECKKCNNAKKRRWELSHPEQNRLTKNSGARRRHAADPERFRAKGRFYDRMRQPEKTDYMRRRRNTNENFRLAAVLRTKLCLNFIGKIKSKDIFDLLGCSMDYFRKFIERQFRPNMHWNNYGRDIGCWNLDHRKPIAGFNLTNPEEQQWAFHYSNVRPLWAKDNAIKSNRVLT